jgi:hypothetical protein
MTIFALAFVSVCHQHSSFAEEDILLALPLVIRLLVQRSLLSHRCDLETLRDYTIQFARTQTRHCGYCHLNPNGWPPNESDSGEPHSHRCSCNQISVKSTSRSADIPDRLLLLLGREDFLANREGKFTRQERFHATDISLLGAFPSLIRGLVGGSLPEEHDCNISPATNWNELSPYNAMSSIATIDDLDGLLNVERSSASRFSEDERIHEVCLSHTESVMKSIIVAGVSLASLFKNNLPQGGTVSLHLHSHTVMTILEPQK